MKRVGRKERTALHPFQRRQSTLRARQAPKWKAINKKKAKRRPPILLLALVFVSLRRSFLHSTQCRNDIDGNTHTK